MSKLHSQFTPTRNVGVKTEPSSTERRTESLGFTDTLPRVRKQVCNNQATIFLCLLIHYAQRKLLCILLLNRFSYCYKLYTNRIL